MYKPKLYLAVLMLIIVSLLFAGCAETPSKSKLEDTDWILESYGEQGNLNSVISGTRITALFDSAEKQVRGSAGCNGYFGEYHVNNGLTIPVIGHTEMYCMEPEGVMDQEQEYLKILTSAESYQIQDSKLQINCAEQKILVYSELEE